MADAINYPAESAALRARLNQLAQGRTKAEIARKTGTSITNVARYLAGTRMPTEFSVAVIRGLGVNPAWWLAGEGTPYVADITAGTGNMAGNVLELVEAMNAVTRMKLGALAGKRHVSVLRELNDALGTYDRLRAKLNVQSREIFAQLLADLSRSLDRFKVNPAAELLKAAQQVARLCDDPDLHRQLLVQQARYHYTQLDFEKALACQRRLVTHLLAEDGLATEQGCQNAVHLVLTLFTLARFDEALRTCEAALKLMPAAARGWTAYSLLVFLKGRLMAEQGELLPGLELMTGELARGGPPEPAMRVWVLAHLLRAGLVRPQDAFGFGDDSPAKPLVIMEHACWLEDLALLRRACDFWRDPRFDQLGDLARPKVLAPLLLRAMTAKDRAVIPEFEAMAPKCLDDCRLYPQVFVTQLHRALGDRKAALRTHAAANRQLAQAPEGQHVGLLTRATHHHNALWLQQHEAEARKFFADHIARGFACFREQGQHSPGR